MFSESDLFNFVQLWVGKGKSTLGLTINAGKFVLEGNLIEESFNFDMTRGFFIADAITLWKVC